MNISDFFSQDIILPLKYKLDLLVQIFDLFIVNILIILLGMIIGKIIYSASFNILKIIKFDTFLDILGLYKSLDKHLKDIPSRLLARLLYWLTLLLFISIAVNRTGVDMIMEINGFIRIIPTVFAFLTILSFSVFVGLIIGKTLQIVFATAGFSHLKMLPLLIASIFLLIALPYSLDLIQVNVTTTYSLILLFFQALIIGTILSLSYTSIPFITNLFYYFQIKNKFKPGDSIIIDDNEMKIKKISINLIELFYKEGIIFIDSKKFFNMKIFKLNY